VNSSSQKSLRTQQPQVMSIHVSMPSAGFESSIPGIERPHVYTLDCAVTESGQ
jgi:hypothetical protein